MPPTAALPAPGDVLDAAARIAPHAPMPERIGMPERMTAPRLPARVEGGGRPLRMPRPAVPAED